MTASRGRVLVTGATGFIGRRIVRRLLRRGEAVVALARGGQGVPAWRRVRTAVGRVPVGGRLAVLEGDLTQADLALGPVTWRELQGTVETVIHAAGDTRFMPDDGRAFRAGHVEGPLALLDRLAAGRLQRWIQLSTAFVCGRRAGVILEREGDEGQSFHNAYERTKLEAEAMVRGAAARAAVAVVVLRPSVVVGPGPATAGGRPAGLLAEFIRLVARLGRGASGGAVPLRIAGAPDAPFNIVPVGFVTEAVAALAREPEAEGETAHLVVPAPPTQRAVLAMVTERLGVDGPTLVDDRAAPFEDPSVLEREVARRLAGYRDYLTQDVRFDDAVGRRLLARAGVPAPRLDTDTVGRLIDRMLVARPPARWRDRTSRRGLCILPASRRGGIR